MEVPFASAIGSYEPSGAPAPAARAKCIQLKPLPGSASNLFALLAGGDVALSVLMTITTTLGAVT